MQALLGNTSGEAPLRVREVRDLAETVGLWYDGALERIGITPAMAGAHFRRRKIKLGAKSTIVATERIIQQMVTRIVRKFQPEMVILFGSQARGDAGPDSDVDLLVVMDFEGSKRHLSVEIAVALCDWGTPMDILVTGPSDLVRRKDIVGTIEYIVEREGNVLYARPGKRPQDRAANPPRGPKESSKEGLVGTSTKEKIIG